MCSSSIPSSTAPISSAHARAIFRTRRVSPAVGRPSSSPDKDGPDVRAAALWARVDRDDGVLVVPVLLGVAVYAPDPHRP
eukprot:746286-Pyramimonas_sp.AAC.1